MELSTEQYRQDIFMKLPWHEIHSYGRDDVKRLIPSFDDLQVSQQYTDSAKLKQAAVLVLREVQLELTALEQKILAEQPAEREYLLTVAKQDKMMDIALYDEKTLQQREIVSVELGDTLHYSGLVMVAKGLQEMIEKEALVPEVIGFRFQEVYSNL